MPSITAAPLARDTAPRDEALPCVIDIEASGFGRGSYPIEIGFVMPDGSACCMLVHPAREWTHWDSGAERIHGISRAMLEHHGRSVDDVARDLNRRLAGRDVYCDNWAHDYAWLARLFESARLTPAFRLRHLRELLSEAAAARFDADREIVRSSLHLRRHRASGDARVLQLSVARAREAGVVG